MKVHFDHFKSRRREDGMATLIFVALLGIMMILVASNVRTILHLSAEEKLLEQKQIQRLNSSQTNVVAAAESPPTPESK